MLFWLFRAVQGDFFERRPYD